MPAGCSAPRDMTSYQPPHRLLLADGMADGKLARRRRTGPFWQTTAAKSVTCCTARQLTTLPGLFQLTNKGGSKNSREQRYDAEKRVRLSKAINQLALTTQLLVCTLKRRPVLTAYYKIPSKIVIKTNCRRTVHTIHLFRHGRCEDDKSSKVQGEEVHHRRDVALRTRERRTEDEGPTSEKRRQCFSPANSQKTYLVAYRNNGLNEDVEDDLLRSPGTHQGGGWNA
ncbi:hypothetical protein HPB50_001879 [Hyalomma asiaticum]|uniref:Uncharacterized protein n=1 Tax=Hyalomma asiaticum TaxID=266040 RepID=A0ACB7T5J6_HYAAI|nr:hypothetical protein HPB50_001879 [Hyalomma asiaticum]